MLSPSIEAAVERRAPDAVIGIAIAMLVLAPETVAAVRRSRQPAPDQHEPRPRLGPGDHRPHIPRWSWPPRCSTFRSSWASCPDLALLGLTFIVGAVTLGPGRTSIVRGAVQLVVFAAFLFLSLVP